MESLENVLRGESSNVNTAAATVDNAQTQGTGETQTTAQPAGESEGAQQQSADGAPPAPEQDKLVPLKALEEERKGRQDWKEKAIRFEEELKHLRAGGGQQGQQQQQQQTPLTFEQALLNERMNVSEMMLRNQHQDVDEKLAVFQAEVAKNPALGAELAKQRHPWEWMYKQAQRIQALTDIGDDPTAYEAKLREKIMAEIQGQQQQQQQAEASTTQASAPALPKSLATARSAGPRSAPTWTGPTPLNDILKPR
ncbi:hypothetical protein G3N58_15135 [Paraburkholderia sp. Ac-20342]|uniref:hypothetical protein n=1 Tax=Paraburkholderia sp. Ac-20342 TaxID=2703889 RepID=UPI00197D39F2|nr:hypothetical protein [Paraburkholderia sp. Ac-20342]MBN3848154.1 hypothetical protein [Paraburkholderia sp. Ac-20342]